MDAAPEAASDAAPDATDGEAAVQVRCPGPFSAPDSAELAVRRRLGIPDDSGCVVVLAQNSHLDIDWTHTFESYYTTWVENILSTAEQMLTADPNYRYSECEMAYLTRHLQQHPEQLASFQAAAARGAFHIVGGGSPAPTHCSQPPSRWCETTCAAAWCPRA